MKEFSYQRRIDYSDTDMGGIVHFARFFVNWTQHVIDVHVARLGEGAEGQAFIRKPYLLCEDSSVVEARRFGRGASRGAHEAP